MKKIADNHQKKLPPQATFFIPTPYKRNKAAENQRLC